MVRKQLEPINFFLSAPSSPQLSPPPSALLLHIPPYFSTSSPLPSLRTPTLVFSWPQLIIYTPVYISSHGYQSFSNTFFSPNLIFSLSLLLFSPSFTPHILQFIKGWLQMIIKKLRNWVIVKNSSWYFKQWILLDQ